MCIFVIKIIILKTILYVILCKLNVRTALTNLVR